ncbi:GNAT family N-acetyltransferase [Bosea sp. (in: a-proteobacteria)]|uniref:GNAT family N-acetyltransferase n=1 Tax=Bosea sp. (in: a-proteobacteria) TaxID=1871050 RepID=UPI002DDD2F8E|nr:GNAT family N-acetyltransferase [Bosea sp. (in: a-proteobacteria)]HEV2510012.1 GNAT family N-acetyltransferase [Bosea sp. (in: a-proteobacteria)]
MIQIRPARRDDVPRIASLIMLGAATQTRTLAEIEEEAQNPAYLAAFAEVDASPYNTLFVAELDGKVVGTLQLTLIPGLAYRGRKRAKLESVHVHPDLRGRRVGEAMVAHAVDVARQKGAGLVELTSDKAREAAHRFYRRIGFSQSHEGFKLAL